MIQIIPAIDVINGKCVRLTQGDYTRMKAYGDPLEMARMFEDHGLKRLHLVDLDGAREKRMVNHRILERISGRTSLVIDAGGGLRTEEDLHIAFSSGAAMVTIGSIAVRERELFLGWIERYGPDKIILGADFREGEIAISGWEEDTGLGLMGFLKDYVKQGIHQAICTDIAVDGTLTGPSLSTYRDIRNTLPELSLVASGGIGRLEDIEVLHRAGIPGVIVGKAIFENRIPLKSIQNYLIDNQ